MAVLARVDSKRGCGWRKAGGMYMIGGELMKPCGLLPIELDVCPCCNAGIRPARGWTWISRGMLGHMECVHGKCLKYEGLPQCEPFDAQSHYRMGLLWVGEKFYTNAETFTRESAAQGISRRITAIPLGFVIGVTWVLLGHRKASQRIVEGELEEVPGIFSAFLPHSIEYVVKGTETDDQIEAMEKRGITCVDVKKDVEQKDMEL